MPACKAAWTTAAMGLALAVGAAAQTPPQKPPPDNAGVFVVGTTQNPTPPAAVKAPAPPPIKRLPDPSPAQIQHIIQVFTAKEGTFRKLLQNDYTYTESIDMQSLDGDGHPTGTFEQTNDIVYSPSGRRQIVCTYCPQPNLRDIEVTEEDLDDMFNMNMYTLSLSDLPDYNIVYLGHQPLDQITAYVFSVTPKQIVKGHRYFSGKVFVDDKDLMIVKGDGRVVPNEVDKHGNPTNTFLPFQVWRQEVDGKYWFPVYTLMQGVVPGGDGAPGTPMRMVIQFKNYKRFIATSRILSVQALPDGKNPAKPEDKKKPVAPTIPH
ncbi:MAG TPA: hypothetical protein VMV31_09085 [Terriglobales bacterium]|nr:hypothetical protein [Terriglobales bacterium]